MKSRPIGTDQAILASHQNDKRDDGRGGSFLLAHQQLGALALGTEPSNGQVIPIVINGTTITVTAVTAIGSAANNVLIGGSALTFVTNLVNFLRRPDITSSTQVAATLANQQLLQYVGWAWPGSSTSLTPFSLNKNVNGITGLLTSFNITGITVTSGIWTAQPMQLYVEDGTYYINGIRYLFTGGSTPTVTAPVSHPRIDVLAINTSGTLTWTTGTESASPSAPAYPVDQVPICELYNVVSETTLYESENSQSGQGYIYNDVRPTMSPAYIGSSSQIATGVLSGALFSNLASIPSGAGVIPPANVPANSYNSQQFTAAQNVTKGKALILGNGASGYLTGQQLLHGSQPYNFSTYTRQGFTFTTQATTSAIRAIALWLGTDSGSYTATLNLYATTGGLPTGSSLGSVTVSLAGNLSQVYNFTFSSPVAVSAGVVYAAIISVSSGSDVSMLYTTGTVAGYTHILYNGSYTTDSSYMPYFQTFECLTTSGQVQHSDTTQTAYSTDIYDLADNFCGFALANESAGAGVYVNLGPIDADQTGLIVGTEYYLNGSGGAIGTSAGGVSVKIGLAVSATQLLVKFNNYP